MLIIICYNSDVKQPYMVNNFLTTIVILLYLNRVYYKKIVKVSCRLIKMFSSMVFQKYKKIKEHIYRSLKNISINKEMTSRYDSY